MGDLHALSLISSCEYC